MTLLSQQLQNALDAVNLEFRDDPSSNKEWTERVKRALTELGHSQEKNYFIYASGTEGAHGGEWLYDLVWLEYDGDNIVRIPLAVESEWLKPTDVLEDFQKLCQSRSELRLMIFQARNEKERDSISSDLKKQICKFTRSDATDQYLLSCWVHNDRAFHHEYLS